jgi:hypothetical protein
MKLRACLLSLLTLSLLTAGCAITPDEGDDGDVDDEDVGTVSEAASVACRISRQSILGSVSGERQDVVERAFTWWDAKVSYSQSRYYKGYRTDCSGFISMAWETGTSYTTASFSTGGGESFPLSSYSSLQPGDALVRRKNGAGHIVMFLGWNDSAKTSACVIEQASTALDMEFRTRSASSLKSGGYKAIRADKLR